jgi:PHD/YefM family antitoxin component YafN of YafNO toxin-antitoxin module
MNVYTYSEARQNLAALLRQAEVSGKVLIRRRDGRSFALVLVQMTDSPLDVPSMQADVSTEELVNLIREGRKKS